MTAKLLRDMERERKAAEQPAPTPNPSSVFIWPSGPPTPPKEDEE